MNIQIQDKDECEYDYHRADYGSDQSGEEVITWTRPANKPEEGRDYHVSETRGNVTRYWFWPLVTLLVLVYVLL